MSTTKKFLKAKPLCKVTFKLPKGVAIDAKNVAVVGEFNDWSPVSNLMEASKDGSYKTTIDLTTGSKYEFKYLVDGQIWLNDEAADSYSGNGFGSDKNSVIEL